MTHVTLPDYASIKIYGDVSKNLVKIPDFLHYVKDNILDQDEIREIVKEEVEAQGGGSGGDIEVTSDDVILSKPLGSNETPTNVGEALSYLDNKSTTDFNELKQDVRAVSVRMAITHHRIFDASEITVGAGSSITFDYGTAQNVFQSNFVFIQPLEPSSIIYSGTVTAKNFLVITAVNTGNDDVQLSSQLKVLVLAFMSPV